MRMLILCCQEAEAIHTVYDKKLLWAFHQPSQGLDITYVAYVGCLWRLFLLFVL